MFLSPRWHPYSVLVLENPCEWEPALPVPCGQNRVIIADVPISSMQANVRLVIWALICYWWVGTFTSGTGGQHGSCSGFGLPLCTLSRDTYTLGIGYQP